MTTNTHEGRFIESGGLADFCDVDVLMLQEIDANRDRLEERLHRQTGLRLAAYSHNKRLAIAIRQDIEVADIGEHDIPTAQFNLPLTEQISSDSRLSRRLRGRGLLAVTTTVGEHSPVFVTTHPIVPVLTKKREAHLRAIPSIIDKIGADVLVLGGDMNHWPRPTSVDEAMSRDADLNRVYIGDIPTWEASKSTPLHRILGRSLESVGLSIDGQLDSIYWSGRESMRLLGSEVLNVASDHNAVRADFELV